MPDDKPTNRNIPLPIKREVRQRCGFGCVICGQPLYEYDHLMGWAEVQRHVAEEITLLCAQHHSEKTRGLLPSSDVISANDNPHNLRDGISRPFDLHFSGTSCEINLGGNIFTAQNMNTGTLMIPLSIDGLPLLGFGLQDGNLLLTVFLFDETNNCVLQIDDNQLIYSTSPWDIEFSGRRLCIREGSKKFIIDLNFDVPNKIQITKGRFLRNGIEVLISKDFLLVTNNSTLLQNNRYSNCAYGLVIGAHPANLGAAIKLESVSRYLGDRTESVRWAKEVLSEYYGNE